MEFDWDPRKAAANVHKHKVSFDKAPTVFGDPLSATATDPDHAAGERRFITVGVSKRRRLLMVAHTERGGHIRIISARILTRAERNVYEKANY